MLIYLYLWKWIIFEDMDLKLYIQSIFLCIVNVIFTGAGILSFWRSSPHLRNKLCYFMIMVLTFFDLWSSQIILPSSDFVVERKESVWVLHRHVYWLFYHGSSGNEHRKISWCLLSILSSNVADQAQNVNTPCGVISFTNYLCDDFSEWLGNFVCSGCGNIFPHFVPFVLVPRLQTVHDFEKSASGDSKTSRDDKTLRQHIITWDIDVAC